MRLRLLNAVAAALLLTVPAISLGLGLGEIQLKSTLNAPLNAEIELTASDEELASLKARLASRDTFSRYGLEYPSFLSGVQVQIVRTAGGRNAVLLSSSSPITEPFATFLVEATWARGSILREYTVLFDPPTFAPQQGAPAPVAAPVAGGAGDNQIARPATPAPAPSARAAAPVPAPAEPPPGGGSDYTVPRGDSLSSIAVKQYGQAAAEQAMIAIFRANPRAFGGNINQLRAGAVLRLPDSTDVSAIDRDAAIGEVRRQMAEWSGRAAGSASGRDTGPRLVLVPPGTGSTTDTGGGSATAKGSGTGESPAAPDNRVKLGDSGLAQVQQGATKPADAVKPPSTGAPGEEISASEVTSATEAKAEPAAAPPSAAPQPAVTVPPKPAAKPAAAPVAPEPSLVDRLVEYWFVPAGLVVLLLLALVVRAARRRRAAAESDGFAPFAIEPSIREERDTSADTFPLRKPAEIREHSIVVEEDSAPTATGRREAPRTIDLDETPTVAPGVDATGTFEQGDPLAEADFHMAYGLYDQAADLVKLAIAREPSRRDLKQKLLEVYFVWGNKEQFLQTARELAETRDAAQPGEWEKVVIMGKQLAPEDPLFTQSYGGVSPSSVDLNLEGGQNLVDFDLPSDSSTRLPQLAEGAPGGAGSGGLDFMLDDPARGGDGEGGAGTVNTVQLPTQEMPMPMQDFAIDGPTVEQPALGIDDTLAGKLGARRSPVGSSDQTAELAIDDLGLDLGKLEATGSNLLDDSQVTRALSETDHGSETLVAGLDDTARQLLQQAGSSEATELLPLSDVGSGDTSRVAGLDLNFDTDSNATTGTSPAPDFDLDLDVGSSDQSPDGEYQRTQRLEPMNVPDADETQRDLEPVSMSEVGTKLDLARAYMDMGDPDGARSILGEVLAEGSPTQRQEAQRLLDSIPG